MGVIRNLIEGTEREKLLCEYTQLLTKVDSSKIYDLANDFLCRFNEKSNDFSAATRFAICEIDKYRAVQICFILAGYETSINIVQYPVCSLDIKNTSPEDRKKNKVELNELVRF